MAKPKPGTIGVTEFDRLVAQSSKEVPADRENILFRNTGIRAEMAQSLLNQEGLGNRYHDAKLTLRR